jgi:hypothetical protein
MDWKLLLLLEEPLGAALLATALMRNVMSLFDTDCRTTAIQNEKGQMSAPRQGWTIAWCHTGDAGGSKRATFDMVRELSHRGHIIDEYIVRLGEPDLSNWPLRPFVRESYQYLLPRRPGCGLRPHLLETWVDLALNLLKRRSFI